MPEPRARAYDAGPRPYTCHLKRLRQQRGWSQSDVAHALRGNGVRVWQSDISRLEHGRSRLNLELVISLLKLFEVEFAELIEY